MTDNPGISDLQEAMQEMWAAVKGQQPDVILCAPKPAWKGNLWRFVCKVRGHQWEDVFMLSRIFGLICNRCDAHTGGFGSFPGLDSKVYDWWRND